MSERVKVIPSDLQDGIDKFILHLCRDYVRHDTGNERPIPESDLERSATLRQKTRYEVEIRRETAHIWEHRGQKSSVAWVVLGDGLIVKGKPAHGSRCVCSACKALPEYFKRGDILKSATWKAPAKNFARGNVLTDDAFPRWHWNGWI